MTPNIVYKNRILSLMSLVRISLCFSLYLVDFLYYHDVLLLILLWVVLGPPASPFTRPHWIDTNLLPNGKICFLSSVYWLEGECDGKWGASWYGQNECFHLGIIPIWHKWETVHGCPVAPLYEKQNPYIMQAVHLEKGRKRKLQRSVSLSIIKKSFSGFSKMKFLADG